jgi:hypothetical protein
MLAVEVLIQFNRLCQPFLWGQTGDSLEAAEEGRFAGESRLSDDSIQLHDDVRDNVPYSFALLISGAKVGQKKCNRVANNKNT